MQLLTLLSPAKINLFLHIIGRREDGYHSLQTAFQFLDFCDEIEFEIRRDSKIIVEMPGFSISFENNLITKAAQLLQRESNTSFGANIKVKKKIPMGGGFGGGSSNAATTLLALNHLWKIDFNLTKLSNLGLQLGADVPVFIFGQSAWAEGVGEELQVLQLNEPWYVLVLPPCEIATGKIFSDPELTRNSPKITIPQFLSQGGRNDCEKIVRLHYPVVARALDRLSQFAPAKLTGTGSGVFAAFSSEQQAYEVADQLQPFFKCLVAKALNQSPVHKTIAKIF